MIINGADKTTSSAGLVQLEIWSVGVSVSSAGGFIGSRIGD